MMIQLCGFGVSNYYNKLKLVLLEKAIPFEETISYPWERDLFVDNSPMGKIPFIVTEFGGLSESQAIAEYLEDTYPQAPLYPTDAFERAKCREFIQHLELNCEWVARRLYKEALFGRIVSQETKDEARERLALGLAAVGQLSRFAPYVLGSTFCAADCAAYIHFVMIRQVTLAIFGEDMVARFLPASGAYMEAMEARPSVRSMMEGREAAIAAFLALNVHYEG